MPREKQEKFHKAEELRARKRDADRAYDFATCHGKHAWIWLKCKSVNPASCDICVGSVRVKSEAGACESRPCGAVQSEDFGGLAPRARVMPDNTMAWIRYDIKDRPKISGTRIARQRTKELRNLDNYEGPELEKVRNVARKVRKTSKKLN